MSIDLSAFEAAASHWIRLVGTCIEIFGVFILVAGSPGRLIVMSVGERHIITINTEYASADRCCSASKCWLLRIL